ncbi:hypothetical protein QQY66_24810 [Streptomyces sp. DG2A-72]|uniref:hypothetical protein n=1 Tax=Streptomyces sp. DG2A-72 TaxID=3051386 RepID=UPI00265BEC5F|nr:hypothetical protein [Streptomyces sp. DG2A-72]MDO0934745.1 hypothetical protein [Streptomyces sp. DG2A-72]
MLLGTAEGEATGAEAPTDADALADGEAVALADADAVALAVAEGLALAVGGADVEPSSA